MTLKLIFKLAVLLLLVTSCTLDDYRFDTDRGMTRKTLKMSDVRNYAAGEVAIAAADYSLKANDRILIVDTTTDTVRVTWPVPPYEQSVIVQVKFTADHPAIFSGENTATIAKDTTLMYYFTMSDTTWKALPFY